MSQFRNTADVFLEVLQKSGEPLNGNSAFQTIGMTYLNRAHHAIIGGGNIFNLNVDEPWVWARSRNPIILELQPAFLSQISASQGDINVYFRSASSVSLEGWHFQLLGSSTVYKITSHAAGSTAAQIDSSFIDSGGNYNARAFKLDYQVFPAYMYIGSFSDKVDFVEYSGTAAGTTRSATLAHGSYSPTNLIAQLVAQMSSVGTATYGGSYDSILRTFNVTASNATFAFSLLGASGANVKRSGLKNFGFDVIDYTGAAGYASTYVPNQIARMIEPFKLFTSGWNIGEKECFIYSSDPIKMQENYPISQVQEKIPDRFIRLEEHEDGTVWVRFNAYPRAITKCQADWIPQPFDLQNNTASVPALPRGDVETLIHAASAMILYDKHDTKFQSMLDLSKTGLDSMKKKNHGVLFRTGEWFGQQVPRLDLTKQNRQFRYGYTVNSSTAAFTTASSVQTMITNVLTYNQFQTASTVSAVLASTLPANMTLFALILKHSQSFTGAGIASLLMNVGTAANPTQFVNGFNPMQAVNATAQASSLVLYFPAVATDIKVQLIATGANLSALSQGSVTVYLQETITNAP